MCKAWKKSLLIIFVLLSFCHVTYGFSDVQTQNLSVNTGVPVSLKYTIRTLQVGGLGADSSLIIISDDQRMMFDNCPGDKIINTSLPPSGIKTYKTVAVFFEPRTYYLTYMFNLSNGTDFVGTMYVDATGFSYDPLNATKNFSMCINSTHIPHRRGQYGFDPTKNIVLERLHNKTTLIIKNTTIIVPVVENKTVNVSEVVNVSVNQQVFKKYNITVDQNLDFEQFTIPTLGTELIYFIIISVIIGIICVIGYFMIVRDDER